MRNNTIFGGRGAGVRDYFSWSYSTMQSDHDPQIPEAGAFFFGILLLFGYRTKYFGEEFFITNITNFPNVF
jgi:hypothetical protein